MIYDKNQFTFNILLMVIFIAAIVMNIIFAQNFSSLNSRINEIGTNLEKIESNQDFNFIQGAHNTVQYEVGLQGFLITNSDDFGKFSGPSMQPAIFDGNTLIEQKYDGQKLSEGQIVRFIRDNGDAVIHRVRADYGDTVFVQGDSLKDGEIIKKSQITHIVVGVLFT